MLIGNLSTVVVWDLKSMEPTQVLSVPGAPLEIRWTLAPGQNWAVTAAALTSKITLIKQNPAGTWTAKEVATIGDPSKIPLPVDISITADGKGLRVNMVSQSWDGKRVYITSSLLSKFTAKPTAQVAFVDHAK